MSQASKSRIRSLSTEIEDTNVTMENNTNETHLDLTGSQTDKPITTMEETEKPSAAATYKLWLNQR
jgi:hypothetical protein